MWMKNVVLVTVASLNRDTGCAEQQLTGSQLIWFFTKTKDRDYILPINRYDLHESFLDDVV